MLVKISLGLDNASPDHLQYNPKKGLVSLASVDLKGCNCVSEMGRNGFRMMPAIHNYLN